MSTRQNLNAIEKDTLGLVGHIRSHEHTKHINVSIT